MHRSFADSARRKLAPSKISIEPLPSNPDDSDNENENNSSKPASLRNSLINKISSSPIFASVKRRSSTSAPPIRSQQIPTLTPPKENDHEESTPDAEKQDKEEKEYIAYRTLSPNLNPDLLIVQISTRLKERLSDQSSYANLIQFACFLVLYLVVLFQQTGSESAVHSIRDVISEFLFMPNDGAAISDWLDYDSQLPFTYDGGLYNPDTGTHVETFHGSGATISKWLTYDILDKIFTVDSSTREFSYGNIIVAGVMVTQKRYEDGVCEGTEFFNLEFCDVGGGSSKAFGTDVTFVEGSPLYNATGNISDYYDNIEEETFFSLEHNKTLPYAFFYAQQSADTIDATPDPLGITFGIRPRISTKDFPVILDRSLSRERIGIVVQFLQGGGYIDAYTSSLNVQILTYNSLTSLFASSEITFTHNVNMQQWSIESAVDTIDVTIYNENQENTIRKMLEVLYIASLIGLFFRELHELNTLKKEHGFFAGLILYAADFGNIVDIFNYCLQVMSNVSWLSFSLMVNDWDPSLTYTILYSPFSEHNILRAGEEINRAMQLFSDVVEFRNARETHRTLACVSLVVTVIQLVKNFEFHPRMGLVTRTIGQAALPLTFFFLLFFSVLIVYACMGALQYGGKIKQFESVTQSGQTLLIMLLGEFGDIKEEMDEVNQGITIFFFWSFMVISFFILMNAFLAIIVEAYEQTKTSFDSISYNDAIFSIISNISKPSHLKPGGKFRIEDAELVSVLDWIVGQNKKEDLPPLIKQMLSDVGDDEGGFKRRAWDDERELPIPISEMAVVVRKEGGDTHEDGTITITGERKFFGQRDLSAALLTSTNQNNLTSPLLAAVISLNLVERFGIKANLDSEGFILTQDLMRNQVTAKKTGGYGFLGSTIKHVATKAQDVVNISTDLKKIENLGSNISAFRNKAREDLKRNLSNISNRNMSGLNRLRGASYDGESNSSVNRKQSVSMSILEQSVASAIAHRSRALSMSTKGALSAKVVGRAVVRRFQVKKGRRVRAAIIVQRYYRRYDRRKLLSAKRSQNVRFKEKQAHAHTPFTRLSKDQQNIRKRNVEKGARVLARVLDAVSRRRALMVWRKNAETARISCVKKGARILERTIERGRLKGAFRSLMINAVKKFSFSLSDDGGGDEEKKIDNSSTAVVNGKLPPTTQIDNRASSEIEALRKKRRKKTLQRRKDSIRIISGVAKGGSKKKSMMTPSVMIDDVFDEDEDEMEIERQRSALFGVD